MKRVPYILVGAFFNVFICTEIITKVKCNQGTTQSYKFTKFPGLNFSIIDPNSTDDYIRYNLSDSIKSILSELRPSLYLSLGDVGSTRASHLAEENLTNLDSAPSKNFSKLVGPKSNSPNNFLKEKLVLGPFTGNTSEFYKRLLNNLSKSDEINNSSIAGHSRLESDEIAQQFTRMPSNSVASAKKSKVQNNTRNLYELQKALQKDSKKLDEDEDEEEEEDEDEDESEDVPRNAVGSKNRTAGFTAEEFKERNDHSDTSSYVHGKKQKPLCDQMGCGGKLLTTRSTLPPLTVGTEMFGLVGNTFLEDDLMSDARNKKSDPKNSNATLDHKNVRLFSSTHIYPPISTVRFFGKGSISSSTDHLSTGRPIRKATKRSNHMRTNKGKEYKTKFHTTVSLFKKLEVDRAAVIKSKPLNSKDSTTTTTVLTTTTATTKTSTTLQTTTEPPTTKVLTTVTEVSTTKSSSTTQISTTPSTVSSTVSSTATKDSKIVSQKVNKSIKSKQKFRSHVQPGVSLPQATPEIPSTEDQLYKKFRHTPYDYYLNQRLKELLSDYLHATSQSCSKKSNSLAAEIPSDDSVIVVDGETVSSDSQSDSEESSNNHTNSFESLNELKNQILDKILTPVNSKLWNQIEKSLDLSQKINFLDEEIYQSSVKNDVRLKDQTDPSPVSSEDSATRKHYFKYTKIKLPIHLISHVHNFTYVTVPYVTNDEHEKMLLAGEGDENFSNVGKKTKKSAEPTTECYTPYSPPTTCITVDDEAPKISKKPSTEFVTVEDTTKPYRKLVEVVEESTVPKSYTRRPSVTVNKTDKHGNFLRSDPPQAGGNVPGNRLKNLVVDLTMNDHIKLNGTIDCHYMP